MVLLLNIMRSDLLAGKSIVISLSQDVGTEQSVQGVLQKRQEAYQHMVKMTRLFLPKNAPSKSAHHVIIDK